MKKLMYILLFLLFAANLAAQVSYVIDEVCTGTNRFYRIDTKEKGSTWNWHVKDTLGNEIANPTYTDFWVESSPGDTLWGSEINYIWDNVGVFHISTLHYSEHGCDTLEQGIVNVYEAPGAIAGDDMIICPTANVTLSTDTALAYSSLVWTTTGDGAFSDETALHPTYFPGTADIISGSVTLILTANGMAINVTCGPAVDSMKIRLSNPAITLSKFDLLCFNDSSGWISATVSGGIEPYIYNWTGPGTFTSAGDSVYGLAAGKYFLLVTDSIGCTVTDSIEITEPLELLATVTSDTTEMCDDGIINLSAVFTGGTGSYTHLWTGDGAVFLDKTDTLTAVFQNALAGIYTLIYKATDENGCVAADTVQVIVLPKDTISVDTVICGHDAPFAWFGKNYFTTGIYTDTLPSSVACDTIRLLNLTVLPIDTIKADTIICISETPFAWYGNDYFTTGIYTDTLSPLIGCDTILVLDLTVLPIDTISLDTVICGLDAPFAWYGKDYHITGIYTDTLPTTVGCDTILILDLTVLPIDTLKLDTVICGNQVPFAFNGKDYFTTNIYTDTLISATGCDSILILDLTVLPNYTITFDTTICGLDAPLAWLGNDYIITGTYFDTIISVTGCDTIAILNLIVLPVDTLVTDTVVCGNEVPFVWNGSDYFYTGEYTDTLVSASGCDSILVLNLTVLPIDTIKVDTIICISETPFAWYGNDYFTTGIYTDTLSPLIGCDTILVLDLTVLPIDTISLDTVICGLDAPFAWYGKDYHITGIYTDTLPTTVGCDTILILDLTVLPIDTLKLDTVICGNQVPFAFNGKDYFTTNIYTDTLISATGCDSILILNLKILPSFRDTVSVVICETELPYTWFGQTFTAADTLTITTPSVTGGCDTILTLNVITLPVTSSLTDTAIYLAELPFVWNGNSYNAGGTYNITLVNANGCDSLLTLNLTVLTTIPPSTVTIDTVICVHNLPLVWNGTEYYAEGQYRDSLISLSGSDSIVILNIAHIPEIEPTFDQLGPYCLNANADPLPFESKEGITGTWSQAVINTSSLKSQLLIFTPDYGQCAVSVTMEIDVVNNIAPAIAGIGPFCENSVAPPLPTVSLNNVTGTWSPSTINTQLVMNRTYTFTPDPGQCSPPVEIDIEILPLVIPTFTSIGPLCQNSIAPALPSVSNNGVKGIWDPAVIDTKDTGTFNYLFTPGSGFCAVPFTMSIFISPEITPEFVQIGPLCQNSTAPALPSVSTNGITGTWDPAVIDTKVAGLTTYTFTPLAGQCAVSTSMVIEITPEITPVFAALGPFCQNSVAPALPLVSENGISGKWSPAVINTLVIGFANYTFTPDPGQCAVDTTIRIEITDKIKPVFAVIGPYCQYSVTPALPLVSQNGITGKWLPDTILTTTAGTVSLKFIPDANQCAAEITVNVEILPEATPVFVQLGPLCQNSVAPALPAISSNGITGTWNPAVIDTKVDGAFDYIFTPDAGYCAIPVNMTIVITPEVKPLFTQVGPLCQFNAAPALPVVSTNGINGTWSPSVIDTKAEGIFTFIFTPAAGECAIPDTMTIEITPEITPVFAQLGPLCQNSVAPVLPAVSTNGISGTWSPAIIDTKAEGTFTFTFTPAPVYCAVPVTMDIVITEEITPVFAAFGPVCPFSVAPLLPAVSTNGIKGTWYPPVIDTDKQGIFNFTFTPDSGQCAVKVTLEIEISDIIPPVAIPRNITVYLDADGKASITTAQIENGSYDNCELDTLYLSRYDFNCDDVGIKPVTLTAVDAVGLIGTTGATVTVLDTISPVVICRGPFEIQLDENAEYKLTVAEVLESVDDNCKKIDTMWVFPHELDCDHIGLTTIKLMVTDVNGNSSYCQTEVMIYGNIAPDINDDFDSTMENMPVDIYVVQNDSDIVINEKSNINYSSLNVSTNPKYGIVEVETDPLTGTRTGYIKYTPNRNFSGTDVFQYVIWDDGIPCEPESGKAWVFVNVEPVNDPPLAVDDYYDAHRCNPVTGNVLDNDSDPDGDPWIVTSPLTPPKHGTLIIDADGTINYFPNEGYIGIDSFQYVIWDNGIPPLSDTAWVYIEVDCSEETQNPLDCELFVPEGFSPNQDGVHDFFRIMCIHNYPDARLIIFNRNGDLLWQKQNYGNYDVWGDQYNAWWWGTSVLSKFDVGRQMINGEPKLKVGNYIYILELGNGERKNGTVMISY